jgi:hypothetical protein
VLYKFQELGTVYKEEQCRGCLKFINITQLLGCVPWGPCITWAQFSFDYGIPHLWEEIDKLSNFFNLKPLYSGRETNHYSSQHIVLYKFKELWTIYKDEQCLGCLKFIRLQSSLVAFGGHNHVSTVLLWFRDSPLIGSSCKLSKFLIATAYLKKRPSCGCLSNVMIWPTLWLI